MNTVVAEETPVPIKVAEITLRYGMRLLVPAMPVNVINWFPVAFTSSSDKEQLVLMSVEKYWENDTNPNGYKVRCIPVTEEDRLRFGRESFYASDLRLLIARGTVQIPVEEKEVTA